jgi:hypothetical protein
MEAIMGEQDNIPLWTPHTVSVWQTWTLGRFTVFKMNFYGPWHLTDDGGKTVLLTDESLQEVMAWAQRPTSRLSPTGDV